MDKYQLALEIKKHKILYYQGTPEVSDDEFDALEEKLREVDPEHPVLQMVGAPQAEASKVKHKTKMLSLGKVYEYEELKKWAKNHEIISMYKIDGVSCSLIYKSGELCLGKTRGDGLWGEDITNKVKWITSVPDFIAEQEEIEIRGEIFCRFPSFEKLKDKMQELGLERPSNPRNIVAGLMGRKENIELASYLEFQAFDVIGLDFDKELEKFEWQKKEKFNVPEVKIHQELKGIEERIEETRKFLSTGDYLVDGLVFVYNDISYQNELGETSHHPRYKMAFKFKGDAKATKIKTITWQISRNGVLTPVAEVEPIEISGAKISRVTLHNFGVVKSQNLKRGDIIEIVRSGEVIPKFLQVIKLSPGKFEIPEKCPYCQKKIYEEDIRLFCRNKQCPGKKKEEILHFIRVMNIEDLSGKRLDLLIDAGLVKQTSDLFKLKVDDLLKLDKVQQKLAEKIALNIDKCREVDLIKFLTSLGLAGGGESMCEKIVHSGHDTIEKVINISLDQLTEVEGFGEKSASDFLNSLLEKKDFIEEILSTGVKITLAEKKETKISGKKFCITGPLSRKRSEIEEMIRGGGGVNTGSVSKNTDFLVTNEDESSSSKFQKAKKLGVTIITENDLYDLLDSANT